MSDEHLKRIQLNRAETDQLAAQVRDLLLTGQLAVYTAGQINALYGGIGFVVLAHPEAPPEAVETWCWHVANRTGLE